MSASITRQRMRFGVKRFEEMAQKDLFGPEERVELIDGDIIPMAPIGLGNFSEPQPDISFARVSRRHVSAQARRRGRGDFIY
jgi:hypothetical protein